MGGAALLPSYLFGLRWPSPGEQQGSMIGLRVNSKRFYTKGGLSGLILSMPMSLWWASADPHLHRRPSNTSKWIWLSRKESLLLSYESWSVQGFVSALQDWSLCFPQSCGCPLIKSHCPSQTNSLGIPSPFDRSPGWEHWHGVQNLTTGGETLWNYFGSPTQWVWNLIFLWFWPFYCLTEEMATHSSILAWRIPWMQEPGGLQSTGLQRVGHDWATLLSLSLSHWGFFVFGVSFFGEFQHPPVDGCSAASGNSVGLAGGNEHTSFYLAILNQKPTFPFLLTRYISLRCTACWLVICIYYVITTIINLVNIHHLIEL